MSKSTELRNLRKSFSTDAIAAHHSRSGDEEGGGAVLLDFVAYTQSAEAAIIEAEERAERQAGKQQFARLLGQYFKKLLTPIEFKFLAACLRSSETPCSVGRQLGITDYKAVMGSINAKHKTNLPKLNLFMRACGYDYRRGVVFMPKWETYIKRGWCAWWSSLTEAQKQAVRDRTNARRAANREEYNARHREYYQSNEAVRQRAAERDKLRYANLTPEQREARRERGRLAKQRERERNREKINERQRRYRAEHPERYREYDRRKRQRQAEKRLLQEVQSNEEAEV